MAPLLAEPAEERPTDQATDDDRPLADQKPASACKRIVRVLDRTVGHQEVPEQCCVRGGEAEYEVVGNYSSLDLNKPDPGANNLPGTDLHGRGRGAHRIQPALPDRFHRHRPARRFRLPPRRQEPCVRGGFGIYYQALGNGGCGCTDGFNGSYSQASDGINQAFNWDQGGVKPPATFHAPPSTDPSFDNFNDAGIYHIGPNYGKAPRIYNWSLTVQHEYKSWLFETAYVGNRGHGLSSSVYLNTLPTSALALGSLLTKNILDPAVVAAGYKEPFPGFAAGWGGGATLAQALRPFPQYGAVYDANAGVGYTWYDALQSKVERRFGALNFIASYVWSKTLVADDLSPDLHPGIECELAGFL